MSVSSVGVTNAYNNIQKIISAVNSGDTSTSGSAATSGGGFGDLVSDALKDGVDSIKKTESVATAAISGKASIVDVVNATNSADIALKTIITMRDKVINAYQDIIKMPI